MSLSQEHWEQIVAFVQREPCTVQDVAKHIGVSWVTAERYIDRISRESGEVSMKVFRSGTRGALKIVYHTKLGATHRDELEKELYKKIRSGRTKHDFDFLEIYQHILDNQKSATVVKTVELTKRGIGIKDAYEQATHNIYIFSGNLSFIALEQEGESIVSVLERALKRGVHIKIMCRITPSTLDNLSLLQPLLTKHSTLEIRHAHQPLRGFIIDDKLAQFKDDENAGILRENEKQHAVSILFRISDEKWIAWLIRVFWSLWRVSINAKKRKEELEAIIEV